MPKLHPSWTDDDSPAGPLGLMHERMDRLVSELEGEGAGQRDEVLALACARDVLRAQRGWASDPTFLQLLEDLLDDVYDLVVTAAPEWRPDNANDCHVQAYALLAFLRAWHAARSDERPAESGCRGELPARRHRGCRGKG
ncbi:hypothetical protein HJD18_16435 [Thermoleophilia bacterium SCSIO 60948]|nr:hypothetical protein HJD18_16435 [Thermoleophilia bacterium SCSIO 60948]